MPDTSDDVNIALWAMHRERHPRTYKRWVKEEKDGLEWDAWLANPANQARIEQARTNVMKGILRNVESGKYPELARHYYKAVAKAQNMFNQPMPAWALEFRKEAEGILRSGDELKMTAFMKSPLGTVDILALAIPREHIAPALRGFATMSGANELAMAFSGWASKEGSSDLPPSLDPNGKHTAMFLYWKRGSPPLMDALYYELKSTGKVTNLGTWSRWSVVPFFVAGVWDDK
jgi:hypothetical protein